MIGGDGEEVEHHDRQGDEQQHPDGLGDAVGGVAGHPGEDLPGQPDRVDDHRQPGGQQYDVGGGPGGVGGAGDGDAGVGLLECGSIVDPVAGHPDDVPAGLQRPHDPVLVLGKDLGEAVGRSTVGQRRTPGRPLPVGVPRIAASRMRCRGRPGRAISRPIATWSPVTILTVHPSSRAAAIVAAESARGGSASGSRPSSRHAVAVGPGDAESAKATGGEVLATTEPVRRRGRRRTGRRSPAGRPC